MRRLVTLVLLFTLATTAYAGFGRGGSSGFSSSRSSFSSRSYSSPRVAPTRTVINNYHAAPPATVVHSGSGFGSSFVGGMAGAAVGNALTNHSGGTTIVQQPVAAVPAAPLAPSELAPGAYGSSYAPAGTVINTPQTNWFEVIVCAALLIGVVIVVIKFAEKHEC